MLKTEITTPCCRIPPPIRCRLQSRHQNSSAGTLGQIVPKLLTYKTFWASRGRRSGLKRDFFPANREIRVCQPGPDPAAPRRGSAAPVLAEQLGLKVIHIAERDTQVAPISKEPGEFVNTWSIDGFVIEGSQPAELGWGTHERHFPEDGRRHDFGCGAAIYLLRPGAATRVRSWTPLEGPYHGFLITHAESISIADYYTVRDGDAVRYRPTAHYAYHPCDGAV